MLGTKIKIAVLALCLTATPVFAGNTTLKNEAGTKVRVHCTGSGCSVQEKKADAKKWSTVEKTKGGTENYNALMAKYKGMGFN